MFLSGSTYHSPKPRSALSTAMARCNGRARFRASPARSSSGWWSGPGPIELAGIEACPLSEWLHRGLREAGISVICIETRQAQRFLSSRPVKTDKNDARGIAEMMRLGHYGPVHVKSPAAQSMRTTLAARMQLVASQPQIEGTIRGLLRVYGLKIGAILGLTPRVYQSGEIDRSGTEDSGLSRHRRRRGHHSRRICRRSCRGRVGYSCCRSCRENG